MNPNSSSSYEAIVTECVLLGLQAALAEANETPLLPGVTVGHTNVIVYGNETGTLLSTNGDTATVQLPSGETTWPIKGVVDIARVNFHIKKALERAIRVVQMVDALQQIFGDAMLDSVRPPGLTADDPTPGCDCPRCSQFTPEQHEDARQRMEAAIANQGPSNRMSESVPDPLRDIFGGGGNVSDGDEFLPRFRNRDIH
jgi:hypothetical protein